TPGANRTADALRESTRLATGALSLWKCASAPRPKRPFFALLTSRARWPHNELTPFRKNVCADSLRLRIATMSRQALHAYLLTRGNQCAVSRPVAASQRRTEPSADQEN